MRPSRARLHARLRDRTRSGFTLLEVLIGITLLATMIAIAYPTVSAALGRGNVRAATDQFVSAHALARSAAIQHASRSELRIDASGDRYWVQVDTGTATVMDTIGAIHDLGRKGVQITADRAILCFDARGLPTSRGACEAASAKITFSSATHSDSLTITALGRVFR